jgi:hypothetical protein
MKNRAILIVSVLAIAALSSAGFIRSRAGTTATMSVQYNKRDLTADGIHIVTPADVGFDDLARRHFRKGVPASLKPFSVFVENLSDRTLVAYVLTWRFANVHGQMTEKAVNYSEPDILTGDDLQMPPGTKNGSAIPPRTVRSFDWQSQILDDATLNQKQTATRQKISNLLSGATDVTVTLDGAIFDDGTAVGTNAVFFQQMQAIVNAKIDLLREVAESHKQGKVDQALESIRAKAQQPEVQFSGEFSADELYRSLQRTYAMEIANGLNRYEKRKMVDNLIAAHGRSRQIHQK